MAETKMAVASAVIVPEVEEQSTQARDSGKRRNSSFSEQDSKRPRLNSETNRDQTGSSHPSAGPARPSDRRKNGQLEERKRGQRLFGALLGTLSQSSSSTAQKRRTDIEKKQQAKLRLQAEEREEQRKQRLESLMIVRRKEQKKYDKQSMHIRHSNMLAQAHFLQTKAEPKLYYKPWELLPREDAKMKSQIEEVEEIIQREASNSDPEAAEETTKSQAAAKSPVIESKLDPEQPPDAAKEMVGPETNDLQEPNSNANGEITDTNANEPPPEPQQMSSNQQGNPKDQEDDGDEMVEADEDMINCALYDPEELRRILSRNDPGLALSTYFTLIKLYQDSTGCVGLTEIDFTSADESTDPRRDRSAHMILQGTDKEAPRVPPESIALYSFKRIADDVKDLARQLNLSQIIVGGHDWGGAIAYRIALWYPELVTHVFSICTPYTAPSKNYASLEEIVKGGKVPNFGYQIQLASGQLEDAIKSKEQIKQLLNGLYGGTTSSGLPGFDVKTGVHLDRLPQLDHTKLISEKMLDFYATQYTRNGIHGSRRLEKTTIDVPVLFIAATKDEALPPAMSRTMDKHTPNLTRKSVDTGHWALWEKPEVVNQTIREWLDNVTTERKSRL
ncbi:MAG: hypothetical protein Q9166_005674 [cf. Caloplaca sp. 2 TL-2023]